MLILLDENLNKDDKDNNRNYETFAKDVLSATKRYVKEYLNIEYEELSPEKQFMMRLIIVSSFMG